MLEEILQKMGLKFDDLTEAERNTLYSWQESLQKNKVTISSIRDYIAAMRDAVEQELIDEPEYIRVLFFIFPNRKQILLKARLKNYMLLDIYLGTPEKMQKAVEKSLAGVVKKV